MVRALSMDFRARFATVVVTEGEKEEYNIVAERGVYERELNIKIVKKFNYL